ncbi:MAG: aminoacyl-tRNA hydrolase [Prolixibacteraceae bacterium]|nr:aminoacyl-tRNA hydrolase [Prolixibacteraceae bacterium]
MNIPQNDFSSEFVFQTSRSSGPGGQNVNKVSSKVELRFNLWSSALLDEHEKAVIAEKLANKINNEGELVLVAQTDRSQLKNKEKVIEKFYHLLENALTPPKKRYRTKPTKASVEKRLESKRIKSTIKATRKGFEL